LTTLPEAITLVGAEVTAAAVISVTEIETRGTVIVIGIVTFGIFEMAPLPSVAILTGIGVAVGIAILTTGILGVASVVVVPAPRRRAISVT